jgi:predicted PurR-regulated permease PerM
VSSVDNVLEPMLVGRGAGMHDLLVFFSMMGGIATFGVMGFIVGPLIAALFRTLLDIYGTEFKRQLELVHKPPQAETEFFRR